MCIKNVTNPFVRKKHCLQLLQICSIFAWGPGTLDLKMFWNLMLVCRIINRSKINIKVYYCPVGSGKPANAKLYTIKKICLNCKFRIKYCKQ